ncbi:MAG: CopG family transcriptional regulator [Gemmatimonadales bacterium]
MADLEKTTVYLPKEAYRRLKLLAREQNKSAAELVREAVVEYAGRRAPTVLPTSIGAGHSGLKDLSERTEDLLSGMADSA